MASRKQASRANSRTATSTTEAVEGQVVDGEVVSSTTTPVEPAEPPKVEPPPVEKKVADVSSIFGDEVAESPHVTAARPEATPTVDDAPPPPKRRGRKKKDAAPEVVEVTDRHRAEALGIVNTMDAFLRMHARGKYEAILEEETLAQLDRKLALSDAEKAALADPLAQGFAEEGVEVPWWAGLALAGIGLMGPRMGMLARLDRRKVEWEKSQEGAK